MAKLYLGEFEELVLTIIGILGSDAYGIAVVNEIKEAMNRQANLSAVHITMYRLEDKGMISSEMRGATSARGGRRKRYFKITNSGVTLLQQLKEQRNKLWDMIPQLNYSA